MWVVWIIAAVATALVVYVVWALCFLAKVEAMRSRLRKLQVQEMIEGTGARRSPKSS